VKFVDSDFSSRSLTIAVQPLPLGEHAKAEYGQGTHLRALPPILIKKSRGICLVADCGKVCDGRQYCKEHATPEQRRAIKSHLRTLIVSDCCEAACTKGEGHDYGEQYCSKCKLACCWKAP
jgi:hypothetical protein